MLQYVVTVKVQSQRLYRPCRHLDGGHVHVKDSNSLREEAAPERLSSVTLMYELN